MSIPEQLDRLSRQGMAITDREQAAHCLRHIGYYRLRSYWHPFAMRRADGGGGLFRAGTAFSDVIALYDFDWRLRALLADALGSIEVSVRSHLVHYLSNARGGGPQAHLNPALFDAREYAGNLAKLKDNYLKIAPPAAADWDTAPIWEVAEAMPFSQLSKWYKSISVKSIRNAIAGHYWTNHIVLVSLLYNMAILRNICAHHGRLWNRALPAGFRIPRAWAADCNADEPARLYNRLVIIAGLMGIIGPTDRWPSRLLALLDEYPSIPKDRMGFPNDWRQRQFWQALA